MFDGAIPAKERKQYLITHPLADAASYNVIRWSPGPELFGKGIVISGKMLTNRGGNGASLKSVQWKDDQTPVVLHVIELRSEGVRTHNSEFVVRINPGDPAKQIGRAHV